MRYEAIPCQLTAYGIPHIATADTLKSPNQVTVQGVTTLSTSIDRAVRGAEDRIRYVKHRLRLGDHQALVNLLDDRPEFVTDTWILHELLKWLSTGRSYRKRGRKVGTFVRHPLIVAAVVNELLNRNEVNNKAAAYDWLEKHGWLSHSAAKESYSQATREERFRAVLIRNPVGSKFRSDEEISRLLTDAKLIEPGMTATYTLATFREGALTVTFEGIEDPNNI